MLKNCCPAEQMHHYPKQSIIEYRKKYNFDKIFTIHASRTFYLAANGLPNDAGHARHIRVNN